MALEYACCFVWAYRHDAAAYASQYCAKIAITVQLLEGSVDPVWKVSTYLAFA